MKFCKLSRLRPQAIVVLDSAEHGQRDQFAASSWRCGQPRVWLRYRV
jgi:hypothetical protein